MISYFIKLAVRIFLHLFYFLPVKQNKIFFSSFDGKSAGCNPLYIFKKLKKHNQLEFIWCINRSIKNIDGTKVKTVKHGTIRWILALLTSGTLITNTGFPGAVPFRKKQLLINTWHGGGAYKKVSLEDKNLVKNKWAVKNELLADKSISYFLSSSREFSKIMQKSKKIPEKSFLNTGMPRNDIFFEQNAELYRELRLKIRGELSADNDTLLVLYAPSFRGTSAEGKVPEFPDTSLLKASLSPKFKKKNLLLFRGHHTFKNIQTAGFDADVSSFDDMQALLCAADVLITDYSSSIWDFSFTEKPCFIFAPDLKEYEEKRGFCTPPESWGFPLAETNEELHENILNFNQNDFSLKMKQHHTALGSFENGTASEKTAALILEHCGLKKGESL